MHEIAGWSLKVETALLIDAVHMFSTVLNDIRKQSSLPIINNNNILQCNDTDSWEQGYSVVNLLKTVSNLAIKNVRSNCFCCRARTKGYLV